MANLPKSFDDPAYDAADVASAATAGIDPILLRSVRTNGERSNADQVSSAGASTPYQFIPATKKAILDKYGIDVSLNPQNASLGAAYLLKEGMDRNKGDASAAVAEYHGGLDKSAHGPINKAYVQRVMGGAQDDYLDQLAQSVKSEQQSPSSTPQGAADQSAPAASSSADSLDALAQSIKNEPSIGAKALDVVTGDLRKTPETEAAPDWTQIPEYANNYGAAGWKAALGTTFSSPEETAQVMKANFPGISVRQDAKGNFFLKSAENGQEYAIKPGFQPSDIPRAIGTVAAFTPAGKASTILGGAGASAATQGAIEASQAATGGEFNKGDIAAAGVIGGLVPAVSRMATAIGSRLKGPAVEAVEGAPKAAPESASTIPQAVSNAPSAAAPAQSAAAVSEPAAATANAADQGVWTLKIAGKEHPVDVLPIEHTTPDGKVYQRVVYQGKETFVPKDDLVPPPAIATSEAAPVAAAETPRPSAAPVPEPIAPPVEVASAPTAAPLPSADLSASAREAAVGSGKSQTRAQQVLAEQAAPDTETLAAAKRLGIEDNLQPDHFTTNQAFRELSQAVKSMPGSEARTQELEGLQAVGKRADDLVTELGGSHDLSTVSQNVKNQMVSTVDDLEKQANTLYAKIRENIPADTRVSAPSVLDFINQRAKDLGGAEYLTPLEKMVMKRLSPKTITTTERVPGQVGITSSTTKQVGSTKLPLYANMDDVRGVVGQAARMNGPFKDADTGLAKKLYGLITSDQEQAIKPFGMTETIDAAKAAIRTRKALEDDVVSLYGKNLGSSIVGNLNSGIQGLGKGDTAKFVKLINAVPPSMRQEVTASALNYGFKNGSRNGSLNFGSFAKWYEGLEQNKQAYTALMANLPKEAPRMLKDLYKVSNGIALASRERIVTGRLNAITKELEGADTAMQKIFSAAEHAARSVAFKGTASAIGLNGAGLASGIASALMKSKPDVMRAADRLITDPAFIAMAKASAAGVEQKASTVKHLARSAQMREFFKQAGQPQEMKNHERWLQSLFQSANESQN
jgi:hypothetical protein